MEKKGRSTETRKKGHDRSQWTPSRAKADGHEKLIQAIAQATFVSKTPSVEEIGLIGPTVRDLPAVIG